MDGLFTLQTPGFFNCLSFYTGLGIYGGKPVNTYIWASNSVQYTTNYNAISQEDTIIIPDHEGFYKPVLNWGAFIPIGIKLSVSSRSNVFMEYVFTRHVQQFKHGPVISEWYRGFTFGYRFKLFTKKDDEGEGIPQTPNPFY